MKTILRSLFLAAATFVLAHGVSAATLSPAGPKQADVDQTFQVSVTLGGATDVDTVRINGVFSSNLLQFVGSQPTGVFQNVSPGTGFNQANGTFSLGAFSLSNHANGTSKVAVLTFKALKSGAASIQLASTSHVLSAGAEELTSTGGMTVLIQPPPSGATFGTSAISLLSSNAPDPNAWYSTGTVNVSWQVSGPKPKATYVGFDQSPDGPAGTKIIGTQYSFNVPSDGVWYVHLVTTFTDGSSKRADLRVQIDRSAPLPISPVVDQTNVPSDIPNALRFGTTDNVSGVDKYLVYLDGRLATSTQANAFTLTNLLPGEHSVTVNAVDKAGNVTSGTTSFTVIPSLFPSTPQGFMRFWFMLILLLLLLCLIWWFLIGRKKRKKQRE